MRTGWTGDWENPLLGQALLSAGVELDTGRHRLQPGHHRENCQAPCDCIVSYCVKGRQHAVAV
jgi:hypothetical protein